MSRVLTGASFRSISFLSGVFAGTRKMDSNPLTPRTYIPRNPDGPFPYTQADLTPTEPGNDTAFYSAPRFVTHIDDNAINSVRRYYDQVLPRKGRILDFCSSWISHYPAEVAEAAASGELEVVGTGMNALELGRNKVLKHWSVQDLNDDPDVRVPGTSTGEGEQKLDASTCVVSIDYLTKPVDVLKSLRRQTKEGGKVHLVVSNRCFPTKVVGRWLQVDEDGRLAMVGDYLWWSGWRNIEIQTLVQGSFMTDPLWVVRGENPGEAP
jgi:SAM-dependent methyltransferase